MRSSYHSRPALRVKTCPLIVAILIIAAGAPGAAQHQGHGSQHEQHDRHNKPVTDRPVPTPPVPASQPQRTTATPAEANTASPASPPAASPASTPDKLLPAPATNEGHAAEDHSEMNHAGQNRMTVDVNDLMVMDGAQMGIRVGRSLRNYTPMGRIGSGTAWLPASSPMYMWSRRIGDWYVMGHGEIKAGINHQGGPRGVTKAESQNWFMPMAYRRVGRGTLQLRGMFSLEPLTFPKPGSPQLFQTGEAYRNEPIIDAQHPHDLFMEMSAQYTMALGERGTWFTYFGYPGEPALGPAAFMHRPSALENTQAPLGHHLQDATHISFGVVTTGLSYRGLKIEGSLFNGREPDDQRYDFEANPWNSRSARVTFAPNGNWSMQFSYGLLKDPELLHRGDTNRMTASIHHNKSFDRGFWATSLIWGRNREEHEDDGEVFRLNSYLAESTVNFLDKNYVYTRLELVDKKELLRHEDARLLELPEDFHHPQFRIGAYTFGAARDVWTTDKFLMGLGGDFTFYSKPQQLDAIYGERPTSYKFFVRFRPSRMSMNNHGGH